MRAAIVILLSLVISSKGVSQDTCGVVDSATNAHITESVWDPRPVYVIPVVVHVITGPESPDVPDWMIVSQMNVLNEDFRQYINTPGRTNLAIGADVKIEFRLASYDPDGWPTSGIVRDTTQEQNFDRYVQKHKYDSSDGSTAWDPGRYFNIWVCTLDDADRLRGFAQYPLLMSPTRPVATFGITVNDEFFLDDGGTVASSVTGRTATHEFGHSFGLLHTFEGFDCTGSGNCETHADLVCDTPPVKDPGLQGPCPSSRPFSCGAANVQFENYMDGFADVCQNLFTVGQANRMEYFLRNDSLLSLLPTSTALENGDFILFGEHPSTNPFEYVSASQIKVVSDTPYSQFVADGPFEIRSRLKIHLTPGARIRDAASFHAWIDTLLPVGPSFKPVVKTGPSPKRLHAVATARIGTNYPNPFTDRTLIPIDVQQDGTMHLEIYDVSGKSIKVLHAGYLAAGPHNFEFTPSDLPQGTYYCRLSSGSFVQTISLSYLR